MHVGTSRCLDIHIAYLLDNKTSETVAQEDNWPTPDPLSQVLQEAQHSSGVDANAGHHQLSSVIAE